MLTSLRAASKSWVSKILLLLLVASFAVWGISGQITGGVGGNTVLTSGETSVGVDEYALSFNRAYRNLQQQFGAGLTREQARAFGLEDRVLSQLLAGAVLDEQARVMRLGLTEDGLAQVIAEDAQNWAQGGTFDRQQLQFVLSRIGLTESDYVDLLKSTAVRQQLVEAAVDGMQAPDVWLDALFAHTGETRDVAYLRVDASQLDPVTAPDETVLQTWFEENSDAYRAPEYRQVRIVRLTADDIADPNTVTEDMVRAEYEAQRSRFGTPETRDFQQIIFADRETAEAARQRVLAGQSFEDAAQAVGRTPGDITVTGATPDGIPDPAIAAAVFDAPAEGDITPVIDGAFGPVLVKVTSINPESVRPLAEVEDQLRAELARIDAEEALFNIRDAYDDARASGQTMTEAASAQGLSVIEIEAVDRRGRNPAGEIVADVPELNTLLGDIFESDVLVENPPANAGDSGFIWYEVVDVTPDRDRTFDEVRAQVEADWIVEQTALALETEGERIAGLVRDGGSIDSVAEAEDLTVERKFGLARNANDADFGNAGVQAIFNEGPDAVGVTPAASGTARLVFRIEAISQPVGDGSGLAANQQRAQASAYADDVLDQMIGRAQEEFPVRVNRDAINRAMSQL